MRTLVALALLVQGALAPMPAGASEHGPTVSFTPTTVSPAGAIVVSVENFTCNQPVTVVLISTSDATQVTTLGAIAQCGPTTHTFTLSSSVPSDAYIVRATDQTGVAATAPSVLPVVARGGVSANGVASCNGSDGLPHTLANAVIQLFSGSDLVARTRSGADGSYSFTGLGFPATFLVEYTFRGEGHTVDCSTTITTTAAGATVGPNISCPSPDGLDHGSWDDAFRLTSGVAVPGAICRAGQSVWLKLAVNPGSKVFVSVTGGGPKLRVELFKDLRKEGDALLSKLSDPSLNIRQLTASMPGVGGTDWDSNDWDSNDWDSNPWDSNDWDSNDWDSNPWDSNDWDSNPCPASACAGDGPIYSAAEQRGLLALSKQGQITRNTWDSSGDYFIRVFSQDASFDPTQTLTINASTGGVCGTGSFNKTPASVGVAGSINPMSLIVTNTARLKGANGLPLTDPSNAAGLANLRTLMNTFAAHAAVKGIVIDLASDSGLQADYAQWDAEPSCVPAANIVSEAIHDVIAQYRAQPGSALKYVTIVGGHTTLPYRLTPDHAEIQQENRYNPGVLDQSESAATLGSDYVMSDNYYISFTPISYLESEVNLPEAGLGVGRLVETSADITNVLSAFLANNGTLTPATALASGYTFVKDLATFEAGEFSKSGLQTDSTLINDTWTMPELKARIFAPGGHFDILALNWHAATNVAVAADYSTTRPTVLTTADLVNLTPDQRFNNTLVMSIGCHLGYNLINPDVIGAAQNVPVTDPRDFTQVLANKGAMVLGNTGYGYGDTNFMGYTERLLGIVTQELEYTDYGAAVPVGLALTRAKRNYVDGAATLTGVDKKSVEQLTFYGPPMWSVALPTRSARPGATPLPVTTTSRGAGLSAGDVTPPYTLAQTTVATGEQYFAADGGSISNNSGTQTLPFRAVQPFKGFDISNTAGTARGVALVAADYQDLNGFRPLVNQPATEAATTTRPPTSRGFTPFMPFGTNQLIGQSLVLMPFQWTSVAPDGSANAIGRRYLDSALKLRAYYSSATGAAALAGPATISTVRITANGSLAHVDATIAGNPAADIADVLVTYTAVGTNALHDASGVGHWVSCNLVPGVSSGAGNTTSCLNARLQTVSSDTNSFVRQYSADIESAAIAGAAPTDLRLLVQAVTGTGLVSVGNNNGQYFQVAPAATISTPKTATAVTLVRPTSPSPYDHTATFTASLRSLGQVIDGQIVFSVGSQRQAAQTVNGTATTQMILQELPGTYQVTAAFVETQAQLGSSASATITVTKKATNLAFGATPFVVTLSDADGNLLRDQTVFFNVNGNGVSQTLTAQTTGLGVAVLQTPALKAGTYNVTAFFLGQVPYDTHRVVNLTDDRYSPASVTTTLKVSANPPSCTLTRARDDEPNNRPFSLTVRDAMSGLANVNITELNNATLTVPTFTTGTPSALVIAPSKINAAQNSQFGLEVVNVAGNVTDCDLVALVAIRGDNDQSTTGPATVPKVTPSEHFVTIFNGDPGLRSLRVTVGTRIFEARDLDPGEERTLDIADGLNGSTPSTVTLRGGGTSGARALVLLSNRSHTRDDGD